MMRPRTLTGVAWALFFPALLAWSPHTAAGQTGGDSYLPDEGWAQLPDGREWGAVTGVHPDPDGRHIWVLDRCGGADCIGSDLAPIFKLDPEGRVVANFGAGQIAWPHGFFVDDDGNVWVTDGGTGARSEAAARVGMGHTILKFSPEGRLLLTIGRPGVEGSGPDTFNGPSDLLVAPSGDIFVLDGHGEGGNNRVVKLAPDGRFLMEWGYSGPGPAAGELSDAHALAMDTQGRLFVADRRNARIQIFDQQGIFLDEWTQFGPPSDLYIDQNDVLYATDTQTNALPAWLAERRPDGWVRGIRIGDARTGRVTAFIPSEAEFAAADRAGNVYGGEVPGERFVRYSRNSQRGQGR